MIFEKIKQLILEEEKKNDRSKIDPATITPEASLVDDLKLDSIDAVHLIMAAEEHFNIEISDEELKDIKLIKDLVAVIQKKVKKK